MSNRSYNPLSLRTLFANPQADAVAELGLGHVTDQNTVLTAIALAATAERIVYSMTQITTLHDFTAGQASKLAEDVTKYASKIHATRKQIGKGKKTPLEQAIAMVYESSSPGAVFKMGEKPELDRRVLAAEFAIRAMDRSNDIAMAQELVSSARAHAVKQYFKETVAPVTGLKYKFVRPDDNLNADLRRANATSTLAGFYEDNEKVAVLQTISDQYMKIPEAKSFQKDYIPGFMQVASESYGAAAGLFNHAGETGLSKAMTGIAEALFSSAEITQGFQPHDFSKTLIKSQAKIISQINDQLYRYDDFAITMNNDYVENLQNLGVLSNPKAVMFGPDPAPHRKLQS